MPFFRNIRVDHVKEYVVIREVGEGKDKTPPEAVTEKIQQGASTIRDKRRRQEQLQAEKRRETREKMSRDEYTREHPSSARDPQDRRNDHQQRGRGSSEDSQNGASSSRRVLDTKRSNKNTLSHKRPRTGESSDDYFEEKKQRGSGRQDDELALKKRLWRELRRLKNDIKVNKELLRRKGLPHSDSEP
eukprot:Protomagalhaensia_wolfi_Nauph_80__2086@NODE_2336_length_1123_cov_94_880996_g1458_i1_p1_GENE_NODE_2336_length_1123_cov_94_880996_g1458_i1NODE_2336_length_1123_cov_94_880996_g1458_i1_p1_ORF_typecomplete_len188_score25_17RNA_capsid/PF03035_14/2_5RNA_capsid/PF03035_14/6_8e02_NODE_2336_length_1123_cov_94_880996_g1458_i1199762